MEDPSCTLQTDAIEIEPCSPERAADPAHMTLQATPKIIPAHRLHIALHVKINHADHPLGIEQARRRIHKHVEVRHHAQAVRHGDQLGLLPLKLEEARVLADDLDVVPAQAREALARDGAQRGRQVDEIDLGEEGGHVDVGGHGLDIPARAAAHVDPDGAPPREVAAPRLEGELGGGQREHVFAAVQQPGAGDVVDLGLRRQR